MKKLKVEDIQEKLNINKIVAELMVDRGLDNEKDLDLFLNGSLKDLHEPEKIPNIKEFADKVKEYAFFSKIAIYSDYDADGVSSAYILRTALKKLSNNAKVDVFFANRFKDGYGLSKRSIDIMNHQGAKLIITLDCGISNQAEIDYARSLGMEVVVIDHHESDDGVDAPFIDLKANSGDYPFTELCGAGAAWKFSQYLLDDLFLDVIDIVAVATVADVVPLVNENRIIVREGLKRMRKGIMNSGLKNILEVNEVDETKLSATDIGFKIGPLINATGRLKTARPAYDILYTDNEYQRSELADELYRKNVQRKDITKKILDEMKNDIDDSDKVIVCNGNIPQGIVGLISGRISSSFEKPSIVVDRKSGKGSGRSIEPFNLYENLKVCLEEDLLNSAGGHSMAAGLNVSMNKFDDFSLRLNELAESVELMPVTYDKEVDIGEISEELLYDLEILEPCGEGNRKPVFYSKNVDITSVWVLPGNEHVKFKAGGVEAIAFRQADMERTLREGKVNLTYTVGWNEYRGRKSLQIIVEKINPFK